MGILSEKKAIIIGGTSGIGEAIVKRFCEEGAEVIFCGRSTEKGLKVEQSSANSKYLFCDITKQESIQEFFSEAVKVLKDFTIAVNCSGISGNIMPFHETTEEMLNQVINTNFFGIWNCLQQEIKHMLSNNLHGSIINISSTSGLIGNGLGLTPYSASKHALVGITKSIALEYAKENIRVNALCPGFVDTPMISQVEENNKSLKRRIPLMHPLGRVATTLEIANAALYLASDQSSFMTGSSMIVDGGLTA